MIHGNLAVHRLEAKDRDAPVTQPGQTLPDYFAAAAEASMRW